MLIRCTSDNSKPIRGERQMKIYGFYYESSVNCIDCGLKDYPVLARYNAKEYDKRHTKIELITQPVKEVCSQCLNVLEYNFYRSVCLESFYSTYSYLDRGFIDYAIMNGIHPTEVYFSTRQVGMYDEVKEKLFHLAKEYVTIRVPEYSF